MTGAGLVAPRPEVRRKRASPSVQVRNLVIRTALILVVAGLVIAGAAAIGYSPLGAHIPGSFFPFSAIGGRGPGGPDQAQGGAQVPAQTTGATAAQAGRTRGGPGAAAATDQGTTGNTSPTASGGSQTAFSGRNAPSLQRGWLEEVRDVAIFAIAATVVAPALRLIRPRRRRVRAAASS